MKRLSPLLLVSLAVSACGAGSGPVKPLGDEALGTYTFQSKGIYSACGLAGFAAKPADFEGVISHFTDGGRAFFVVDTVAFDAGYDRQLLSFVRSDKGGFLTADGGSCKGCDMDMTAVQAGNLVLLSSSQSKALGDVCPTTALDGGVPAPDEDAGIKAPGKGQDGGYDAVLACGEVEVNVRGEGFCDQACYSCIVRYRWTGTRTR